MENVIKFDIFPIKGPLANIFLLLLNILFTKVKLIGDSSLYPPDHAEELYNGNFRAYDFIIVGAGTAGCTLAMKITFFENFTVLLLETGDYPSPATDIPGFQLNLVHLPQTFKHSLEPQKKGCLAMNGGRCVLTRGRALGGTSTIDNMHFVRPEPYDVNKIGISFWTLNITHQIFEMLESFYPKPGKKYQYLHEFTSGRVKLGEFEYNSTVKTLLKEFYKLSGFEEIPKRDFIGFSEAYVYSRHGVRMNSAKLFVNPIKNRPNLAVAVNTHVTSVAFGGLDKKAQGVFAIIKNKEVFLPAKKEVILTTGAINNAKLLFLSGIGPKEYLEKHNISVIADNVNVGENLQFHISVPLFSTIDLCGNQENCTMVPVFNETAYVNNVFHFVNNNEGDFSTTRLNNFVLYLNSLSSESYGPNVEIFHNFFEIGDMDLESVLTGVNYKRVVIDSILKHNEDKPVLMLTLTLLHPRASGRVLLNDTDIYSDPIIIPNFFEDPTGHDLNSILEAIKIVHQMTEHPFMQQYGFRLLPVDIPNCRRYKSLTLSHMKCYITAMSFPNSDVSSSTKMGTKCQWDAVTMLDKGVKGVRCLRIGDVSVFPYMFMGNLMASNVMVGYRLGEIIRQKWLPFYSSPYVFNSSSELEEDEYFLKHLF